jgi:hypothetical protein
MRAGAQTSSRDMINIHRIQVAIGKARELVSYDLLQRILFFFGRLTADFWASISQGITSGCNARGI